MVHRRTSSPSTSLHERKRGRKEGKGGERGEEVESKEGRKEKERKFSTHLLDVSGLYGLYKEFSQDHWAKSFFTARHHKNTSTQFI